MWGQEAHVQAGGINLRGAAWEVQEEAGMDEVRCKQTTHGGGTHSGSWVMMPPGRGCWCMREEVVVGRTEGAGTRVPTGRCVGHV